MREQIVNDQLLVESVRLAQIQLLLRLDALELESGPTASLLTHWNKTISRLSNATAGARLGISADDVKILSVSMKDAILSFELESTEGILRQIQQLRFLTRVESIVQNYNSAYRAVLLEPQRPEDFAKKQVRALELVVRALVQEKYVVEEELINRLRIILKHEDVGQMIRQGRPDGVLAGTLFRQLVMFFTDSGEWHKYSPLYQNAEGLKLLKDQRLTIISFLTDINGLRNVVAHHRSLSRAQIELLNAYYTVLVEPIQKAFEAGHVAVNPKLLAEVDGATLDEYISSLRAQGERTEKATNKIHLMVAILLLLVGAGIVGVITFYQHKAHNIAIAYQSLGWATASSSGTELAPQISSIVFLGDETVSFRELTFTAVALSPSHSPVSMDLTSRFDPSQVGGQQIIVYAIPRGTRSLVLCLVTPSRRISGQYRVTQSFTLDQNGEPSPRSARVVSKEDGSPCDRR